MANYLISGVFFEKLVNKTKVEQKPVMYSGWIQDDTTGKHKWWGEMSDIYGKSKLYDPIITPSELSFLKMYDNRSRFDEGIIYFFKPKGLIWVGTYTLVPGSKDGHRGVSKCVLNKLPEDFLFSSGK